MSITIPDKIRILDEHARHNVTNEEDYDSNTKQHPYHRWVSATANALLLCYNRFASTLILQVLLDLNPSSHFVLPVLLL